MENRNIMKPQPKDRELRASTQSNRELLAALTRIDFLERYVVHLTVVTLGLDPDGEMSRARLMSRFAILRAKDDAPVDVDNQPELPFEDGTET